MKERRNKLQNRRGERGFVLLVMGAAAVVVAGILGLAMDVGRTYITKNEAQAFADAAALAAALKLDGTTAGVTNAQTAATSLGNKWNFASTTFSGTTVEVATSSAGPWTSASSPPSPATNYTYVRVTASASVNLYFTPVVTSWSGSALMNETVKASATAAQLPQTTWNEGAFPFSPIAFDGPTGGNNTSSPWGFIAGNQYTMRYAANGKSECAGDAADSNHLKIGSARGYWGSNSASTASAEIEGLIQEESLTVGQVLPGVGGAKTSVQSAIVYHIDLDGDTTDDTYAAYLANPAHNGQRVVTMPMQSEVDDTVLGFGSFFLLDDTAYGHTGNSNWCAIYIGLAGVTDTDISALLDQAKGTIGNIDTTVRNANKLVTNADGLIATLGGNLNSTVNEVKTTVSNANELIAGIKEGRGAAGMLLRDEALADQVRQAVTNIQGATSNLKSAAANAGTLVSELQSKGFPKKVDDTLTEVNQTAKNFNAASAQVRQVVADLTGPDEDGATAVATIRESLSNVDVAAANMADETEALEHNLLLRGFFRKRGYYSLTALSPEVAPFDFFRSAMTWALLLLWPGLAALALGRRFGAFLPRPGFRVDLAFVVAEGAFRAAARALSAYPADCDGVVKRRECEGYAG